VRRGEKKNEEGSERGASEREKEIGRIHY